MRSLPPASCLPATRARIGPACRSNRSAANARCYWRDSVPFALDYVATSIEARPITVKFKTKGGKLDFRVDAKDVLWAKQISSVWPSSGFFETVKTGEYDLQLVLDTGHGLAQSSKLHIWVDAAKPVKK